MDPHCLWWLGWLSTVLPPNKTEGLIFQNFGINIGIPREAVKFKFHPFPWPASHVSKQMPFLAFFCLFVSSWIWPVHHLEGWGQLGIAMLDPHISCIRDLPQNYHLSASQGYVYTCQLPLLILNDSAKPWIFLLGCVNWCQRAKTMENGSSSLPNSKVQWGGLLDLDLAQFLMSKICTG